MEKGKRTCNVLKAVRLQIAKANEIKYEPHECHHEGPCAGTCPACEAEVRYLEQQLQKRRMMGRAVMVTGIAAGMTALASCTSCSGITNIIHPEVNGKMEPVQLAGDVDTVMLMEPVDTITPITQDEKVLTGVVPHVQPQFPGGESALRKFIQKNVRYPESAAEAGIEIEGRVMVTFKVEKDGSLSDIKVVRGLGPEFDEEALRVVKMMPKWLPARTGDSTTVVRYTIPVVFKNKK